MNIEKLLTLGGPVLLAAVVQLGLVRSRKSPATRRDPTPGEKVGDWCLRWFGALLAAGVLLTAATFGWALFAALFDQDGFGAKPDAALGFFATSAISVLLAGLALQAVTSALTWSPRDNR